MSIQKTPFITIAHNIFLNSFERYGLREENVEIDTVGICLPVWVNGSSTSEPAEEVYCRYRLRNYSPPEADAVSVQKDGFCISLGDKNSWHGLLDMKDGGSRSIYLSHQSTMTNNEVQMLVIHYINIQDISVLTKERSGDH